MRTIALLLCVGTAASTASLEFTDSSGTILIQKDGNGLSTDCDINMGGMDLRAELAAVNAKVDALSPSFDMNQITEGRTCHYNYIDGGAISAQACADLCDAQEGCNEFSLGGKLGCRYAKDIDGCCRSVPNANFATYCEANLGWNKPTATSNCGLEPCKFYIRSGPGNSRAPGPWSRALTASELATATCTQSAGENMKWDVSTAKTWNFYDLAQSDGTGTGQAWVCDITAHELFTKVSATYHLEGIDKDTGANQDPDDNEAMAHWGSQPSGHSGYFSFGTPTTIVNAGGTMGGNTAQGTKELVTFAEGTVVETDTVRFGFAQSAEHETFSVHDVQIIISGTR